MNSEDRKSDVILCRLADTYARTEDQGGNSSTDELRNSMENGPEAENCIETSAECVFENLLADLMFNTYDVITSKHDQNRGQHCNYFIDGIRQEMRIY